MIWSYTITTILLQQILISTVDLNRSEPGGFFCACKVTAFFPSEWVIHNVMLRFSMQRPLCFCTTFPLKMLLQHTGSNKWKHPVGGLWKDCLQEEKKRLLSLLIMCTLRASDKPTSQDGSEKVERNARVYQHSQRCCRSETGTHTHWLTHTSETHIKSRLLATAKGCKHKAPQQGPPRLQNRSFLCLFNGRTVSVC